MRLQLYAAIIAILLIGICSSIYSQKPLLDEERHMIIVAVKRVATGFEGVSADLYVRVVCPGEGHVYVETRPLSEVDTQASARIAAMVASRIARIPFTSCDFFVSIRASTPIIGGPSASAAMTIAFAAALLRLPINESIVITGMIMPDGSVGPVGGLVAKLEAAASRGAKVFLVPYGQTKDIRYVVVERRGPGYIYREIRPETVDLIRYGSKLGVKVIPVATVYEALEIFTNGKYEPYVSRDLPTKLLEVKEKLTPILRKWIEEEKKVIEETERLCNDLEVKAKARPSYRFIADLVSSIAKKLDDLKSLGRDLEGKELLYSAASAYFQAMFYAKWKYYMLKLFLEPAYLDKAIEDINSSAHTLLNEIRGELSSGSIGINKLSVLINTVDRVYEALLYLNESKSSRTIDEISQYLAYADARLTSAKLWLKLGGIVSDTVEIPYRDLVELASTVIALARDVTNYVLALAQTTQWSSQVLEDAYRKYSMATEAREIIDKLALGIDALSSAYLALVSMLLQNNYAIATEVLNKTCTVLLSQIVKLSVIPTDIVLYIELAKTYSKDLRYQSYLLTRINMELATYIDSLLRTLGIGRYTQTTQITSKVPSAPLTAPAKITTITTVATVTSVKTVTITREILSTETITNPLSIAYTSVILIGIAVVLTILTVLVLTMRRSRV